MTSTLLSAAASSTLLRAQQTAGLVCKSHLDLQVQANFALNEVDFGASDGLNLEEARKNTNRTYKEWTAGNLRARSPGGGESFIEVQERQREAIKFLLGSCAEGQSVLAVSHSSYLRLMLSLVLGWSLDKSKAQPMENCAINVIDFQRNGLIIPRAINDVRHLQAAGALQLASRVQL